MKAKLTSFLSILCLLMVFAAAVQAAPAGKVTNLEGRADLTAPGQPAKALLIGDTVNVGDILRTKSGSKLEVTWIDGSIARLSENSRLKVTEFTLGAKKRSTILSLFRGKVQNVVTGTTQLFGEKDGSRYEVHTPTSVCGVRGTVFFTYHENGISGALFTEGKGFMYSKGQPGNVKPVAPGILMIVTSANKPPEAKPAKPGDATKLFNATNPSEKKKDDKKGEEKKEGATGGGTSGTGGTTSMLGGDPTATLGTAAPGTLASQIESGTTADTPGTTSTITNTTNQGQINPPIYEQPSETLTTFTQNVSQGTISGKLTGSISDNTNTGTLSLAGTGMESIYVVPTTGSLSDGSTDNSYLAGIPGSWRGLFIGLSRKGTSVSLLSGTFPSGAYTDQTLNAAGSIARASGSSIGAESQYQAFTDLPLLVLQNVSIGQAFSDPVIYGPSSGDITTDGIMGYSTSAGGILGIWGAQTLNGAYINATGDKSKTVNLYHYNYNPEYQDPSDYFAFGSAVITDDLLGHTTVKSSSLTYLDRNYLGTLSLDYRGVYNFAPETTPTTGVSYPYSSIGTGVYNLQPLAWSGDWGMNRYYYYPASLYANFYNEQSQVSFMQLVAHDMGLAGGTTPFWTGQSHLTALGYLTEEIWNEETQEYITKSVSGETVAGPLLWNSGIAAQALTGATVEDIFTPDAEFAGFTAGVWKDGLMKGSAYAIYKTAAGQAGWLIGKDTISGLYDSEIGLWKAEGDLTPTQKIAQLPDGVTSADLEVAHDFAMGIAGGSFGGQGSILNQFSILQTTFYGKGIYDEEGYLDKVLPLRWGIYDLRTASGNAFSGKPAAATSWTAKIGGYGPTQMNAPFFYLADISGTWAADETISGQLSGTYMTPLYLGVLSGPFYGLYNIAGTDQSGQYGGWTGQSIGTYNVTQKLAHSAVWDEDGLFTDAGGELDNTGYVMGLLGGTTAPWIGSSAFKAMGLFQLAVELGLERGTYLWNGAIQGSVPQEIAEPASAGGIYTGYSAALWQTDSYAGAIRTIYLTPPDATTGKSTAGFLTGDSIAGTIYNLVQDRQEYDGYVETYTVGLWESTGTNTLTASTPVATGLDPEAVTLAGGSMNAKLSGTFGGAGALTNDAAWGDFTFFMNGATPLPFGVYDLKLGNGDPGGTFSGKPTGTTAWTAKIGGAFNYEPAYEYGYWLADVGGQWNAAGEITGNVSNGTYLTPTQMGTLSGPFYGLYTEGETPDSGTWVGQSIGNYEGKNLAYSADTLLGNWAHYDAAAGLVTDSGAFAGIIGGVSSIFGDLSADINGMGTYSRSLNSPLFMMTLVNAYGGPETNPFRLYYGGAAHPASEGYGEWFEGRMMGFYAKWNGTKYTEFGLLSSDKLIVDGKYSGYSVDGYLYPGIGMWNMYDYKYQGRLTSTKMADGEFASFTVEESDWSSPAPIVGDLQGTMQMQTAKILEANEGWGIWMSAAGGSAPETIPETGKWAGATGWKETNESGKASYTIASVDGYAGDGGFWAGVSGRFLNPDNMGIFTGDLVGIVGSDTWQATGIGSFEVTKTLAFSSSISGDIYKTAKGTLNVNAYAMPGSYPNRSIFEGMDYETVYFRADNDIDGQYVKYGWQREAEDAPVQRQSYTYYPNDSYQWFPMTSDAPTEALGKTSTLQPLPDFYTLTSTSETSQIVRSGGYNILTNVFPFSGELPVNPAYKQFAKVFSRTVEDFYATTRLVPDINDPFAKTFQGIMGGYVKDDDPDKATRTLWNATDQPMGLALMGEHASFDGSASMTSGIESSTNGSSTTPDGGAYYGFLTNHVDADRTIRGMFYGLYISPAGNAGFLQSTDIEGSSYAGLNMWEATGSITGRQAISGISVAPAELLAKDMGNYVNLKFGAMSGNVDYGNTSGNFVSGGSIRKLAMDSGYTVSINGYPCNGIFLTGGGGGTYANPGSAKTWQADSSGYAIFGYPGSSPSLFPDYGIWRMNVDEANSLWAANEIYASVTGEFLSYAKQGTLTGTFLGSYAETDASAHSGVWGGTTSGVYEKTRSTAFSSGMRGNVFHNKEIKWISGGTGNQDNFTSYYIFGDPANFPAEEMDVHKMTGQSGIVRETQYDYQGYTDDANPIAYIKTTWQYSIGDGGVAENMTLLESKTISNDTYLAEVAAMRSGVTEYSGYRLRDDRFQGVFAGFGNLWNNIAGNQPTEIALAGLYDVRNVNTPGIFTAGTASFNPAVNMDPFADSTSQIGGAYVAMLGGVFGTKTVPYDTMEGLLSGLYYKDGTVGLLYGSLDGSNWTDIGYLKGSGAIDGGYALGTGVNEGDFALTSANFASKIISSSQSLSFDEGSVTVLSGDQVIPRSAEENLLLVNPNSLSAGGIWGIEQKLAAGTKTAGLAPTAWAWEIPAQNVTAYGAYEITSTSNGISTGSYVGARIEPGLTMIEAGSIKGLFDPNATTWQAVSQGTFMGTNTFVAKVSSLNDAGKKAFMDATKIPAVQVGQATLSQASGTTVNNLSNVAMNNVGFYAYSTGAAPKIWATNNVSGSYSGTPSTSGLPANNVPLSGGGLNANFNVNQWNGGTWSATVAGSGALSSGSYNQPIQFAGGAAGAIQPATGSTGSFSGTGAGIAK